MINTYNNKENSYTCLLERKNKFFGETLRQRLSSSVGIPLTKVTLNFLDASQEDLKEYSEKIKLINKAFRVKYKFPTEWILTTKYFYEKNKLHDVIKTNPLIKLDDFNKLEEILKGELIPVEFKEILKSARDDKDISLSEGFNKSIEKEYSQGKFEINLNGYRLIDSN